MQSTFNRHLLSISLLLRWCGASPTHLHREPPRLSGAIAARRGSIGLPLESVTALKPDIVVCYENAALETFRSGKTAWDTAGARCGQRSSFVAGPILRAN